MKIVGWTSFDSNCQGICVEDRETLVEALNETVRAIREDGYIFAGDTHQRAYTGVPVFDNGKCLRCSMRGWGILMSFAYTGSESSYMDYYMAMSIDKETLPDTEADEDIFLTGEEEGFPYYYANQDIQLAAESASAGIPLMTFDPVVTALYDILKASM